MSVASESSSLVVRLRGYLGAQPMRRHQREIDRHTDDQGVRERLSAELAGRYVELERLVAAFEAVDDRSDLYTSLCFFWLELRCAWNRRNTVIQYRMAQSGQVEPELCIGASLVAAIVGELETFLASSDLDALGDIAAQPLDIGRRNLEGIESLVHRQVETGARARHALDCVRDVGSADEDAAGGLSRLDGVVRDLNLVPAPAVWSTLVVGIQDATVGGCALMAEEVSRAVMLDVRGLEALRARISRGVELVARARGPEDGVPSLRLGLEVERGSAGGLSANVVITDHVPRAWRDSLCVADPEDAGTRWKRKDGTWRFQVHVVGRLRSEARVSAHAIGAHA